MSNPRQAGPHGPSTGSASPKTLTSERIAADIAAFNKAGGRIEVLGNTPLHHKSAEAETPAKANSAAKAGARPSGQE
ncbi:hypothetical protein [Dyella choica]|uniref:Uncharacterized protein n=1 Tax=Dyella choica TaxID=1927959 RepID=A0A3S0RKM1_9GAMM|nr:hypothetical protein [Dyella choica]RUL75939.1 hypothetical protein EKH80_09445 [Dyella choica]